MEKSKKLKTFNQKKVFKPQQSATSLAQLISNLAKFYEFIDPGLKWKESFEIHTWNFFERGEPYYL